MLVPAPRPRTAPDRGIHAHGAVVSDGDRYLTLTLVRHASQNIDVRVEPYKVTVTLIHRVFRVRHTTHAVKMRYYDSSDAG